MSNMEDVASTDGQRWQPTESLETGASSAMMMAETDTCNAALAKAALAELNQRLDEFEQYSFRLATSWQQSRRAAQALTGETERQHVQARFDAIEREIRLLARATVKLGNERDVGTQFNWEDMTDDDEDEEEEEDGEEEEEEEEEELLEEVLEDVVDSDQHRRRSGSGRLARLNLLTKDFAIKDAGSYSQSSHRKMYDSHVSQSREREVTRPEYRCPYCPRRFGLSAAIQTHMQEQHGLRSVVPPLPDSDPQ